MKFIDLYTQYLSIKPDLDKAIASVIQESSFIRGRHVDAFEEGFARLLGVRHCVSCANGTDALYIGLKSLGLKPGDEVITTAHSWISTSETITQAGGKVVFCDTEEDYFCIDPTLIESKITPRTRGITVVHLYGQSADMRPILEVAKRHNLWLIEDCAQAHLAEYEDQKVGTFGDLATFSFYPGKNLGAMGDAGCLVTNRDDVADFATLFARHGGKGDHQIEGINSRMDGLQAAILHVKSQHLAEWTDRRIEIAAWYDELLSGIDGIYFPKRRAETKHVYHLYVIRCNCRDELRNFLQSRDIPTLVNYPKALPYYPAYAYLEHSEQDFPIARRHSNEILSLPMYPELERTAVTQVVEQIHAWSKQGNARCSN